VLPDRWGQAKGTLADTSRGEWVAWAPLVVLMVLLGLVPSLIFSITNDAVNAISHVIGAIP
jgi:NADH:ubiquinone oxidoreductase subunit 4 (subunit M)